MKKQVTYKYDYFLQKVCFLFDSDSLFLSLNNTIYDIYVSVQSECCLKTFLVYTRYTQKKWNSFNFSQIIWWEGMSKKGGMFFVPVFFSWFCCWMNTEY